MNVKHTLVCLSALVSMHTHAGPMEDGQAMYDKFLSTFAAGNQIAISDLFAPDALFYGTGSSELVTSHDGVIKYFDVLKTVPSDTKAWSLGNSVIAAGKDVAMISGMWQWSGTFDGTLRVREPLRMSMVVAKRDGKWSIVQFHNSLKPAPRAPAR